MVLDLVQGKVLMPRVGPGVPSQTAPAVSSTPGQAGSESDLETRIDVAPLQGTAGALGVDALKKLLNAAPLEAMMEFHSLRHAGSPAFVEPHTAILIRSSVNWDSQTVRDALRAAIRDLWTTSEIGVNWVENREDNAGYFHLDGLVPLAVAVRGPVLLLANSDETLRSLLVRAAPIPAANPPGAAQGQNLVYAAGFHHAAERENIVTMMRLIEMPEGQAPGAVPGQNGREPGFFSENLASLSQSLESIESESLVVEDRGPLLVQTATYRLKK
jgi:hypothetical protein